MSKMHKLANSLKQENPIGGKSEMISRRPVFQRRSLSGMTQEVGYYPTFGEGGKMVEPYVALQSVMMPSDTNPHGTIFGGVILSNLDMAGAIAAARETRMAGGSAEITFVTVAMNRVEFKQPVFVGDVVRYETTVAKWGRTSITLNINVISDRLGEQIPVTEAEVVYVGVNKMRQPVALLPSKSSGT